MLLMARKHRNKSTTKEDRSSNEALRVLASLIAQFHLKKLGHNNNLKAVTRNIEDDANDQSLS
jgi:hypothetical protein